MRQFGVIQFSAIFQLCISCKYRFFSSVYSIFH